MAARLTIGRLIAALTGEFPDLTPSKIRFLETEGLLTPERTPSGYRTYSEADVERMRYILTAQRERYWPLRVIKEALDALDRGLAESEQPGGLPTAPAPSPDPDLPRPAHLRTRRVLSLTGPELRSAAGLDRETFHALESFGLLEPDPAGHFDANDLDVAIAAGRLAAHGLEARHLRPFRTAADREIGLVHQVLSTSRGEARDDAAAEMLTSCIALHVALVKARIDR
ncbi:MAG: MerR family transcriptional regulator [Intrasporangium sp.]|uniref:transcriptional regulator FtsR n=1 Tax=Intrasporangium sp. TaxID=1925024 RepID=UPI002647DFB2|nr:MerR family transcriptional regulator [Intrasporangium sp.]MDN5794594.1 MerR family transcriptional regulator [Intrasporangium sp.]